MKRIISLNVLTICIILLSTVAVFADAYARPRVLTTQQGINDAIARIETDETVAGWYKSVLKKADNYLKADLITDKMDSSADMMYEARKLKERILALGFVYFKTGNDEYAQRACDEVLTACGFDWGYNVSFLGVAEMAFGVALGYDWLYDEFTDEERALIENTLMDKAIIPYYNDVTNDIWWGKIESNWNIVCNGGVLTAIIALNEKSGDIGAEALAIGLENINSMMPLFGPGGAWEEGLMYWRFTTEYFANFVSTLINYSGMDFGYCEWKGVDKAGYYPYLMSGAGGGFSYSDCEIRRENPPQVFWFATYFGDTALAGARLNEMKKYRHSAEVRDILWYNGESSEPILPKDNYFGRVEAFSMRDTYENTDGVFLAGKGGQIGISHSHFDAGSFVLDALGKRFVTDLGREDYNAPSEDRYQLYRNRAEGHNTIVVNPSAGYDQTRDCVSRVVNFKSGEKAAFSVIDLTPAYRDAADMKRGFFFDRVRKSILLQDEIILEKESDIWWFVHTGADITLSEDKKTAVLDIDGKKLFVRIKGDNDYCFDIMEAKPFPSSLPVEKQDSNNGVKKLAINIKGVYGATIRVSFTPDGCEEGIFDTFVPVNNWGINEGLFITSDKKSIAPGESFNFDARLITASGVNDAKIATWYLEKAYQGVSIDSSTGKVYVSDGAKSGKINVVVRNGARVAKAEVDIAPITFTLDSMPLSALVPSEGTTLIIKPKYTVRYENGGMAQNENMYTLKWSLKEPVHGVSVDEKSGHITIDSNTEGEYAEITAELDGRGVLSRKLYFQTKSLSSSEMGAIAWNLSGFGKNVGDVIDGDRSTYMDTGRHSENSDTRVWLKLADEPVLYNKVRITVGHTENTKQYMLTVSDKLVGDEPAETTKYNNDAPILYPNYSPGGQTICIYKEPTDNTTIVSFPQMESKYLSFENKNRGKDDIPNFLLNEIEVFNSTVGNAQITVNAENPKLIQCSAELFDTEGDSVEVGKVGIWSIENAPKGISISQTGEITVEEWAEKKDITILYTFISDSSTVLCRKTITAGFAEMKLSYGEKEAEKLEKGRTYTAEFSGDGECVLAMYRIENDVRTLFCVKLSGGTITVPDDGCEYEIKLMRMDMKCMMPYCVYKEYKM